MEVETMSKPRWADTEYEWRGSSVELRGVVNQPM